MKTMRIRNLLTLAVCCLAAVLLSGAALAADTVASGTCGAEGNGSNLTWTLDSEGTLTISGQGKMRNYTSYLESTPWIESGYGESIKAVNIGNSVTAIGDKAFSGCTSLTSVNIPSSVTSIGAWAFSGCTGLTSVSIPSSVTSIGYEAFKVCKSLTSVTIPEGVTSIGGDAFYKCTSLTSVTIPEGMTSIGSGAFANCSKLITITLPGSITSFGGSTFKDCKLLTSVVFLNGIVEIPSYIFYNCSNLSSVTIPGSVTTIGDYAFSHCSNLKRLTIPDGVITLGKNAFEWCNALTSITLPDSLSIIGDYSFYYCGKLNSITIPSGLTSIGDSAFYECNNITEVHIKDMDAWCRISFQHTPVSDRTQVFLNGEPVTSVTVPADVTSLKFTFRNFKDLINVVLPNGLTNISNAAFAGCEHLEALAIPNSVTNIGGGAFSGCYRLANIAIPSGVTSIGDGAFYNCSALTSIDLPDGTTKIEDNTFYHSGLVDITIPDSVISIGSHAFYHCLSLKNVTLLNGVTTIGKEAFANSALRSITIPSSMATIERDAFSETRYLHSIFISDLNAWCNISFQDDESNPLCYGGSLYLNGAKVETLEIPEGTVLIQPYVFLGASGIKRVFLPQSIVRISSSAFCRCYDITDVYFNGSQSEWDSVNIGTRNDSLISATLHCNSSIDDYYYRITVKVCDGGRVSVSANTAVEGETITVTATPYAGYQLDGIYVDGTLIEGNTFTVTGNHEVSAKFSLLPVYGGTDEYRLEGITVTTAAGEKVQELRAGELLVSIAVRHVKESSGAVVMLAQYDAEGRYQGLLWLTLDEMPLDMALKVTLPVDNSDGKIANLKAFVVSSILSPVPMGNAVSFGSV